MSDDSTLGRAKAAKRRAIRPLAADHVPAVLAASAAGAMPVVVAADPAPVAPPAAVPAEPQQETIMDTTQTVTDTAAQGQAVFADLNTRAKGAMEKGQKMFDEMNAFGKDNVEAMVESSRIAAKGLETLGQEAAEFARRQVEGATQAMKTLAAAKSPTEFLKLQGDYARAMFDTAVAEASRSTEKMIKLANDIAQPISNRVAVAAEKVKMAA